MVVANKLSEEDTMSFGDLNSSAAVEAAIEEFDAIGRAAFLDKYGYGEAREYFLVHGGRYYDSKAVVGVAHGYQFPNQGPLEATDFSGGRQTVQRKLQSLGFTVVVREEDAQRDVSERYGGSETDFTTSRQGFGLSAPERKVVEMRAVNLAVSHFEKRWKTVEDVGGTESYDLRCRRGNEELHVEVKGSTGAADVFNLTAKEVEHARDYFPDVALVVVSDIQLDRTSDPPSATDGNMTVYSPWDIDQCKLHPTQYDCSRPYN